MGNQREHGVGAVQGAQAVFALPYGMHDKDVVLDDGGATHSTLQQNLQWLADEAMEEELPTILAGWHALWLAKAGTIGECLDTAIVWERG